MKSNLQYTLKVDLLKLLGIALCSPLCMVILNQIVTEPNIDVNFIFRILISLPFAFMGLLILSKAIDLAEEVDNAINRRSY